MPADARTHTPVLVEEVLAGLDPAPSAVCLDCTYGRGGHTKALLERLGPGGRVLAVDRDPAAVAAGGEVAKTDRRLVVEKATFARIAEFATANEVYGRVDGVLFDLGVSSPQLEDPARGFGFLVDGPLDMRMDPESGVSAAEWLRYAGERQIAEVLWVNGEERYARRIARAIVRARRDRPIETTGRLADVVSAATRSRERNKHPATRTFQAIRIHVNNEIQELSDGLQQTLDVLAPGGRLAVISFHSLEDRVVKRFIRSHSRYVNGSRAVASAPLAARPILRSLGRPVRPRPPEIQANPRARSAILRLAERRP